MTRSQLIDKIEKRKKTLGISIENLACLSHSGIRTINRLLAGEDVKLSTVEKVTTVLGLDFAGNETVSRKDLERERAKQKAVFMASLVQGTSALECQGLEQSTLEKMIKKFEKEFLTGSYRDRLWVA